jgi:RNA polymerase sigma-70 factor (ECF subfamily)
MGSGLQENGVARRHAVELERWMERYQEADSDAPAVLITALSPALLCFFRSQPANRERADDLLQDTWLRIHRVRHTYRPGEPVLPWVFAIARRVGVDSYRKTQRINAHEISMEVLPEQLAPGTSPNKLPMFEELVAGLPAAQQEVVTMLKVGGLSLEEVARATSSTVGAVKQKAHRAYERLRNLLNIHAGDGPVGGVNDL